MVIASQSAAGMYEMLAFSAAALDFPTLRISIPAQSANSTDTGTVVACPHLFSSLSDMQNALLGTPVWLRLLVGREHYRVPCVVHGLRNPLLLLSRTGPAERLTRRDRKRLPCSLAALFRPIRAGGAISAWLKAEVQDLNIAGAKMRIWAAGPLPDMIELQIQLPERDEAAAKASIDQDKIGTRIVHGAARVRHRQDGLNGDAIGVKFENFSADHRLALGMFVEELAGGRR